MLNKPGETGWRVKVHCYIAAPASPEGGAQYLCKLDECPWDRYFPLHTCRVRAGFSTQCTSTYM